ncbi:MAG: hypothetical protein B6I38_09740 [Anaerolineaceae bacterium 4572_5.1]|nr:MAG: hypothetical protein B6I38_09740 [Anaerolineaceae bacterium 4572_5.1]
MDTSNKHKPKILVIDDDYTATELFRILLEPANYTVLTANSGEQGLELIQQSAPDLVILDLLMPGMDGWQTCTEIRKFSHIPIIIISVITASDVIAKALNLGADEYLPKPVSPNMLIASINNLLRRANSEKLTRSKSALGELTNTSNHIPLNHLV